MYHFAHYLYDDIPYFQFYLSNWSIRFSTDDKHFMIDGKIILCCQWWINAGHSGIESCSPSIDDFSILDDLTCDTLQMI